VIEDGWLIRDLLSWSEFYVAGRLQKPCLILHSNKEIETALKKNLRSAVTASCLLLPNRFTERELFTKITSLSYLGDPRMKYNFENPNKVLSS
jgi:mitochondrial translocator assembly and maintenance protein 41